MSSTANEPIDIFLGSHGVEIGKEMLVMLDRELTT